MNFLAEHAACYPTFQLKMEAAVTGLVDEDGRVVGVRATTRSGRDRARSLAHLVVGADGRHSTVRERGGLKVDDLGAPIDVLWMRFSRCPGDRGGTLYLEAVARSSSCSTARISGSALMLCPRRVSTKSAGAAWRRSGSPSRRSPLSCATASRELRDWNDVKLLTVLVDRVRRWYRPGLLCIGSDAAHAMSPVGGVGINLAIQDAVASANVLFKPLREGELALDHLRGIQRRRELPTRVTQWLQVTVQRRIGARVLVETGPLKPPLTVRLLQKLHSSGASRLVSSVSAFARNMSTRSS